MPVPDPESSDLATQQLKELGFDLVLSERALSDEGWHSGTAEQRAADLQEALLDPEVDGVVVARGGYGCSQLLPHLDRAVLREVRKPFIGFSDVTALHVALQQQGLVTFYGPTLGRFALEQPDPLTTSRFVEVLRGDGTGSVAWQPSDREPVALAGGRAEGVLVGGWLTGLVHLMGTPWQLDVTGRVLLLEEVSTPPHDIDRKLVQLGQAGWLDAVAGIVVGECADCEPTDHPDAQQGRALREVLESRLGGLGVPVLYDVPVGHGSSLATVPLGVQVTLDADAGTLTVDEPALA
jgi:muramoyltetrapeptide carboxypeptidase